MAADQSGEKRTAKITIEVSFYDDRKEMTAASRTTTLHFDSWEKASQAFEKARGNIIADSPIANQKGAITPTPPKANRPFSRRERMIRERGDS